MRTRETEGLLKMHEVYGDLTAVDAHDIAIVLHTQAKESIGETPYLQTTELWNDEDKVKRLLEDAASHVLTAAENPLNADYWRVLADVLMIITEDKLFAK